MHGRGRKTGSEPAFRRTTAEHVYTIEAAHNPEVAGSNPAPVTQKGPGNRAFLLERIVSVFTCAAVPQALGGDDLLLPW
jgi:hypothetical protein